MPDWAFCALFSFSFGCALVLRLVWSIMKALNTHKNSMRPILKLPVSYPFFPLFLILLCGTGIMMASCKAEGLKDSVEKAEFIPHKALYELELAGTKSGSQIVNITGQMFYEWYPSCDGWISNNHFTIFYEYADLPGFGVSSDFSTFESFDGQKMDFTSQRKRDRVVLSQVRGYAEKNNKTGENGKAAFSIPYGLNYELPTGTFFPMEHSLSVLKAKKAGKKFYNATVFDGSDENGPLEINAFIGREVEPNIVMNKDIDADLLKSPASSIRLAFFPLKDSASSSDYEMSAVFHDNSVISDMLIDYDDFSVHQKLVALEKLEGTCQE